MSDTPYREAWASLVNFTQGFAAPMLALLPILEQAKDAEAFIATLQPQIDEKQAELAAAEKAVEQAKADRQAVLDSIEHDRVVKQTDANQQLDAYRLKIQAAIDQLTADREHAQAQTSADLLTLAQQIENAPKFSATSMRLFNRSGWSWRISPEPFNVHLMRRVPNLSVSLRVSLPLTITVLLALPLAGWGQQELRSGKKGATVPAPVTSTSVDADTQALDVAIKAGTITLSGADGAIQDGATPAIRATVKSYANSKPLAVVTVDTNGDPVAAGGGGGGTQYTEDAASVSDPVGNQIICRRRDTLAIETTSDGDNTAVNCTSKGELYTSLPAGAATEMTLSTLLLDSTVTSRLPPAFASANAIAAQTATFIHGGLMGWNGAGWDLLQVDGNKNLKTTLMTALPSGSNIIGGVDLAQYTPVSGRLPIDGSGVIQPVSGTVTANIGTTNGLALDATLTGGTQKAIVRGGAKGTSTAADVTSTASGANHQILDVAIYDNAGNQITSFGGAGGTSSTFGAAFPSTGTAAGFTDGTNMQPGRVVDADSGAGTVNVQGVNLLKRASGGPVEAGTASDPLRIDPTGTTTQPVSGSVTVTQGTGTNLHVVCDSGCSSSAGFADNSAFTFGTTAVNPIAGVLDDTATNTATENSAAVARITAQKGLHVNIRNNSGTELGVSGAPLRVDPTGTTTQPISASSLPLPTGASTLAEQQTQTTALQLLDNISLAQSAATAGQSGVLAMGAVTAAAPTYTTGNTNPISLQTDGSQRVAVTNTPTVSGSGNFTVIQSTASNLNAQVQGTAASGAAKAGNPVQIGGVYNSTQPTVTTGQAVEAQATARGALIVSPGTEGFPIQMGMLGASSASWTSATSVDTTLSMGTRNYSSVVVSINPTTTFTGGAIIFEASDDDGTTWYAIKCTRGNAFTTDSSYTIVASTKVIWQCDATSYNNVRVRLNPAITGTGTAVVRMQAAVPPTAHEMVVGQSVAANLQATVNVNQVGGSSVSTADTGVQKVGIVGNAAGALDAANNSAVPANVIANGAEVIGTAANPTAATAGNMRRLLATTEGILYTRPGGSNQFTCRVAGVTATTQCQAAPGAGLKAYVTDVFVSNNAGTAQTIDLVFGTGTNCGTGTTQLMTPAQFGAAVGNWDHTWTTPLNPTAANAICVRPTAATSISATITGFIAP